MSLSHPREAVDLIARHAVSLSRDALYRDCVVAQKRDESVALFRLLFARSENEDEGGEFLHVKGPVVGANTTIVA